MDMRISNLMNTYSVQARRNNISVPRSAGSNRGGTDSIDISTEGNDFNYARNAVRNAPDVREDRVNQIQSQLANGTYSVSTNDVAASILQGLG